MQISSGKAGDDSTTKFKQQLLLYIDAGAGVVHVRTNEVERALVAIRHLSLENKCQYTEWDAVFGVRKFSTRDFTNGVKHGEQVDFMDALRLPLARVQNDKEDKEPALFVYASPQAFLQDNPVAARTLDVYNDALPSRQTHVILVTPDAPLPGASVSDASLTVHFATPSVAELLGSLNSVLESVDGEDVQAINDDARTRICFAGLGLTLTQFETYVSLAVTKTRSDSNPVTEAGILDEVRVGKTQVVNGSDILELMQAGDIADVGGMENLKSWVEKRGACFSDEAADFGVEPPKGFVLVGIPGSGKSLVAKAAASVLGVPLVRLDFSRVFSSYVGSSEQRMRSALRSVEAMAPLVLLCDEIDKGLGGIANGSGADSGVSMRVLGSFLTWLQECKGPVFTVVTANSIENLPPELTRRGRFDAVFSTCMPTVSERREVLAIHLRKRGHDIAAYAEEDVLSVLEASDRYVPAEIEAAVKDALVEAFSSGEQLSMTHIVDALQAMVPMSKAYASKIAAIEEWSKANATPVHRPSVDALQSISRRVRAVPRGKGARK